MSDQYQMDVLDAQIALQDNDFVADWDKLLQTTVRPTAVYASPTWIAHLCATDASKIRICRIRDHAGSLVGVVPIRVGDYRFQFSISNRVLYRRRISAVHLLGSDPPLPENPDIVRHLINSIFSEFSDCKAIYADAVPTDSKLWQMLQVAGYSQKGWLLHVVDGPRPWHLLDLRDSFDDYLMAMSSKARANLRREVRKLQELAQHQSLLWRVSAAEDVEAFLEGATKVNRGSWQHRILGSRIDVESSTRKSFEDLATRGILRAYLLNLNNTPCAFVIGYQHYGVYCYAEIGFDESFAEYSPGKVLLFLIIEDLHKDAPPKLLDFGMGDAAYKRRFANREESDMSCLIIRKSITNRILLVSHSLFTRAVSFVKAVINRKVTKML